MQMEEKNTDTGTLPDKMQEKETEKQSLEELFDSLDKLSGMMEDSSIPLEKTVELYKKGRELLKECQARIDLAEKQVLELSDDGETDEFYGAAEEVDFADR